MTMTVGRTRIASGTPSTSGRTFGKMLDQANGVVAHVAEHAGRHGGQVIGQRDLRFRQQRAQRGERAELVRLEGAGFYRPTCG